jgi:hypothetical protein
MSTPADSSASKAANSDPVILRKDDPAEVKRRWLALLDEMDAMPQPDYIEKREPIIWRDA